MSSEDSTADQPRAAQASCAARDEDLDHAEELRATGRPRLCSGVYSPAECTDGVKPVGRRVPLRRRLDGDKVVCYFSAEERVDFRQLLCRCDLRQERHERIDMRRLVVRERPPWLRLGPLRPELCCTRFGLRLRACLHLHGWASSDPLLNSTKDLARPPSCAACAMSSPRLQGPPQAQRRHRDAGWQGQASLSDTPKEEDSPAP